MCEALRARQVYWAERDGTGGHACASASSWKSQPGEKVLLVDDILRTGTQVMETQEAGRRATAAKWSRLRC